MDRKRELSPARLFRNDAVSTNVIFALNQLNCARVIGNKASRSQAHLRGMPLFSPSCTARSNFGLRT